MSPRDTGLPLSTHAASLVFLRVEPETLRLTDVARRAASTWTAQFAITIQATINAIDYSGDLTPLKKPLYVVGRISLSATGGVDDVSVSSIASSPDDPMRQLWDSQTLVDSLPAPASTWQAVVDRVRRIMAPDSDVQAALDRARGVMTEADVQAVADLVRGTVVPDSDLQAAADRARSAISDSQLRQAQEAADRLRDL